MKKRSLILIYIIFCLAPTIFLFINHNWMCRYDMNPLCYIQCVLPALLGSPILLLKGSDE